jgi:CubicO group peptidase (beta-lactamase class C family)
MSASIEIHGTCDDRFEAVRAAFSANFETLADVGASVSATIDGETVVDLWAGTCSTDAGPDQQWDRDTIINVWSSTKTMSFLMILMLADRGLLDLDAPVADVWPEFAANDKHGITTKHLLSHAAGLSGFEVPARPADLYDWDLTCSRLAAQTPWWQPGTASGYHAITQGSLLGEVARRVDGRTMGTFLADEVTRPLGADFHIGTTAEHDARVAHVIPPTTPLGGDAAADSIAMRTFRSLPLNAAESHTIPWRRAEIPAAGGHGNARSIARVMSILANEGTLDGTTFLSSEMCDRIFDEQQNGIDLVLGKPLRFGLGFGLSSVDMPLPNPRCCYWGGWGGSIVIVDMENRMSFSYVMNEMRDGTTGDLRGANPLFALYAALATAGTGV